MRVVAWLLLLVLGLDTALASEPASRPTSQALRDARRQFQLAELTTASPSSFIFNPGQPPRIIWRDVDEVRRLGSDGQVRVRWFDAELNESANPTRPGRWGAYVEATAPNGTIVRRSMTFYCRPPGFFAYFPPNASVSLPHQNGPISQEVWGEHTDEISTVLAGMALGALNDSEAGAILIAGLSGMTARGGPPRQIDSAAVSNDDFHLAMKLKVQDFSQRVRPPRRLRKASARSAPVLRPGSPAEAGVRDDAKAVIDDVCRSWAHDSGEAFATLVARRGVIITHEAFGHDISGRTITRDYRCGVASITKSATAMLFAQFVDQELIRLDDPVSAVFIDYPDDALCVPTFRQCFTHTSGLVGHGDFGGCRNPHLENIILNAIDVNEPGTRYEYSGMGFDLAAKAMELVAGKSWRRLFEEHLFGPLGMGDVPMTNASAGAEFTAHELALLAQLMLNRGSYGEQEFFSEQTFARMLPEPLDGRYPGVREVEGIGNHWMKHPRPGAAGGDTILSGRTIGHGSLSGCMFLVDLERELVIVQVRKQLGPRYADWSPRFLQAVADSVAPEPRAETD